MASIQRTCQEDRPDLAGSDGFIHSLVRVRSKAVLLMTYKVYPWSKSETSRQHSELPTDSEAHWPYSPRTDRSPFVNAAFTAFGVAVTVGHAFEPVRLTSGVWSTSYIGNQMA
jgi:hypothetical protein